MVYKQPVAVDLYAILGVDRLAKTDEIKSRHRHLVKTEHPDLHQGLPRREYEIKESAWQAISEAYSVLKDSDTRAKYDWEQGLLREAARAAAAASAPPRPQPGQHIKATLRVPLLTAIKGGKVRHGIYDITIPRGATSGLELRLTGRGHPGNPPGDLLLTVQVETHPTISRVYQIMQGDKVVKLPAANIHMTLVATWYEAYRGGTLQVPTPWGLTPFKVNPMDADHNLFDGLEIIIPGYGQRCTCPSSCRCPRGDLIVTWRLMPPDPGDTELETVLAKLQPRDPRAEMAQQMEI
jgi:curved DNA-binding protein